jgi:NADPH:quinone reductase-like Zn-dependent oxidoreductase
MRAALFEAFGNPSEVLRIREVPDPHPGPGEVRVRMILSPVNPSDLLVVHGRYGALPRLPATPGFEGVGVVDEVGPGLMGRLVKGKRVAAINAAGGNWAEYAVIPWRMARPVPDDLPDEQAATFFVNPASVLAMVRHILRVRRGEWLLQSAAGSALGRMIIKLGRNDGFRTINTVRRRAAITELTELGGDVVISSEDGPIDEQVRRAIGNDGVRHAIDPVGGTTGTEVFRSLGPGGRLLLYGTLSGDPISVDPRFAIAGARTVEGFWLGHWVRGRSIPAALRLFRDIGTLIRQGVLDSPIGRVYPLDKLADAIGQADTVGRQGKVLVRLDRA